MTIPDMQQVRLGGGGGGKGGEGGGGGVYKHNSGVNKQLAS